LGAAQRVNWGPGMTSLLALLLALAAPPAAAPAVAPPPPMDFGRLLARLAAGEPTIGAVQAAAARVVDEDSPDPSALAERRRVASLLPKVTAEVRHDEQTYRVYGLQGSGEVDYLRSSPGTGFTVRASWDLGDLIAGTGEPLAASATLTRAKRRDEAVQRTTGLYFERQRLRLLLALEPPSDPRVRGEAELELEKVTAELDHATGGLFGGRSRS
jgi:hypothetical protein